ncbi:MAG: thioredoxin family protein [Candidatus Omnitrophica bacterium]|nr:thioredoxin family protein [Candidatus Omnitrophota bacterium]
MKRSEISLGWIKGCALIFLGLQLLFSHPAWAVDEEPVRVELLADVSSIQPGQPFWVGVHLIVDEGWHTYWLHPGKVGLPTTVEWKLPDGWTASDLYWPPPQQFLTQSIVSYGYPGNILLMAKMLPPQDLNIGDKMTLQADVEWAACKVICVPGISRPQLTLPVKDGMLPAENKVRQLFNKTWEQSPVMNPEPIVETVPRPGPLVGLIATLLAAFLGGLLLNLMPCVFPVMSLKILGFAKQAGDNPSSIKKHGLVFFSGVLVSFWVLAGILIVLRSGGQLLGWGFQLQSPGFVLFLVVLLFMIGLNLLGIFEIGLAATRMGSLLAQTTGYANSFGSGILATILATPCTAPFMGLSIGYGLTRSPQEAVGIFTLLAVGMATPYLLLSFFPGWLGRLPKPGPWMVTFRKWMSLPIFLTVVWLLWILNHQTLNGTTTSLLEMLVLIAGACWIYGKGSAPVQSAIQQLVLRIGSVLIFIMAMVLGAAALKAPPAAESKKGKASAGQRDETALWKPYSFEEVRQALREGKPVFIDFSAAWCLTCQFNQQTVLHRKDTESRFRSLGIVTFHADWTSRDPEIAQAMVGYGRSGVPLYVLYSGDADEEPQILPEILTQEILFEALKTVEPDQSV